MPVAEMRPLPTPKSPLPGWRRYGQAVNPSKMKYLFTTLILLTCALTAFCRPVDTVEVHTGQDEGIVSPLIMGFNTVYCYRSEEHTSELQSLMRISSAVFCLKKKIKRQAFSQ